MNQKISDADQKDLDSKRQGKKYGSIWDIAAEQGYKPTSNGTGKISFQWIVQSKM